MRGKFRCPNTLSLVSFAGMTLDKCIVLRIGTLTGCPLCRESHPLCRLKNTKLIKAACSVTFDLLILKIMFLFFKNTVKILKFR